MRKFLLEITEELHASIDVARGAAPRNPWLERELWKLKAIRDGAKIAGVENPRRPMEGRGGDMRTVND